MTDNTMREGKLWAFLHDSIHEAYKKLSTTGTSNEYHALLDSIASKVADDVDARFLQAAQSVPVVGEPVSDVVREYTTGRWHHGNGFLCMGTLRIARADLDTNPSAEVQSAFFDEICATLNAPIPATLREKAAEADELRECKALLSEARKSMRQYEADCDEYPPFHHNKLMERIDAAIAQEKVNEAY